MVSGSDSGIIGIAMVVPEHIVKFIVDIGCFSLVSGLNLSPQAEVFNASSSDTLDALVISPGYCILLNFGLRVFMASFEILLFELVLRLRAGALVLLNYLLLEAC